MPNFPRHLALLLTFVLALAAPGLAAADGPSSTAAKPATAAKPSAGLDRVFVDVERFEALRASGAAILDVRSAESYRAAHVPGAAHTEWTAYVDGASTGVVSADDRKLTALLRAAGVRDDRPVLVYGNWSDKSAWGEEGRVMWTLQYLGKREVHILRGGFDAWRAGAGTPPATGSSKPAAGNFTIRRQPHLRATTDELLAALEAGGTNLVLLDTREAVEFDGTVKYGEARPGRMPGAKHLWWYDLFAPDGTLKSADALRATFARHGITDDSIVVAYCTGGIRSGFVYAVLQALGYRTIKNYDGSMWEWTAREGAPLE